MTTPFVYEVPSARVADQPARVGDRIQTLPHTDMWVRGDRFGVVEKVTASRVWVRLDRSGRYLPLQASAFAQVQS